MFGSPPAMTSPRQAMAATTTTTASPTMRTRDARGACARCASATCEFARRAEGWNRWVNSLTIARLTTRVRVGRAFARVNAR